MRHGRRRQDGRKHERMGQERRRQERRQESRKDERRRHHIAELHEYRADYDRRESTKNFSE